MVTRVYLTLHDTPCGMCRRSCIILRSDNRDKTIIDNSAIFSSQYFPFSLDSRLTANIVFVVYF